MGTMSFLLPAALPADAARELERACVAGGPDNMPWPTEVRVEPGKLTVRREVDESGCLVVPWDVDGAGRLMGTSATLVERDQPYQLRTELARGKVNQVRCAAADWQAGGLQLTPGLAEQIRQTGVAFSRVVTQPPSEGTGLQTQAVVNLAYRTAEQLVGLYVDQMFDARHQRQPRLETGLGCRLRGVPLAKHHLQGLAEACNTVALTFAWSEVEPAEATYQWEPYEELLKWAEAQGLPVTAGPLIDFSTTRLPDWLWLWDKDLSSVASFMCDYVETAVKRYAGRIRTWQLTAASNCAAILGLGEDELLWLTARLAEAARQVDPKLELIIGVAQPWGEYMAVEDRTHSPFIFADTLVRSGLSLAALDLELVMGVTPRGSYCRDPLDASRLIDLYSMLNVPLRLTLAYPAAAGADKFADQDLGVLGGRWRGGFTPAVQAEWAAAYGALAVCKPSVRAVQWAHLTDAAPHLFPHCGLFDAADQPRPVLAALHALREAHLK